MQKSIFQWIEKGEPVFSLPQQDEKAQNFKSIFFLSAFLLFLFQFSSAQRSTIDSLRNEVEKERNDTMRMILYQDMSDAFTENQADSGFFYIDKSRELAHRLGFKVEEATAVNRMGYCRMIAGVFAESLRYLLKSISMLEDENAVSKVLPEKYLDIQGVDPKRRAADLQRKDLLNSAHHDLGHLFYYMEQHDKAIEQYLIVKKAAEGTGNNSQLCFAFMNLGRAYFAKGDLDQALFYEQKANELAPQVGFKRYLGNIYLNLGNIYLAKNDQAKSKAFFRMGEVMASEAKNQRTLVMVWYGMANMYLKAENPDSSLWYAHQSLSKARTANIQKSIYMADTLLALIHKSRGEMDSAFYYLSAGNRQYQAMFNSRSSQEWQAVNDEEKQRQGDLLAARKAADAKLQKYALVSGLLFLMAISLVLWANNRKRSSANKILREKKNELEATLDKLRATQTQLVQSEKMASLGELTAGIAHEIQNPLNFINNFSEVNVELIDEMQHEMQQGNISEATGISKDIQLNLQKISHHGKRADAIVKSMLQHSRKSTGIKESADINALVDEYLRLAYHGLRAKDKSFNAILETHFDPSVGKVDVIVQDIGRVLLNLFGNAFYAVNEKKKTAESNYEPMVQVITRKVNGKVEIVIRDNGTGIPEKVLDKIYQPFFTTKPTGDGTGLGLSLSYDIITKAHSGELKLKTEENQGAEFSIILPE